MHSESNPNVGWTWLNVPLVYFNAAPVYPTACLQQHKIILLCAYCCLVFLLVNDGCDCVGVHVSVLFTGGVVLQAIVSSLKKIFYYIHLMLCLTQAKKNQMHLVVFIKNLSQNWFIYLELYLFRHGLFVFFFKHST